MGVMELLSETDGIIEEEEITKVEVGVGELEEEAGTPGERAGEDEVVGEFEGVSETVDVVEAGAPGERVGVGVLVGDGDKDVEEVIEGDDEGVGELEGVSETVEVVEAGAPGERVGVGVLVGDGDKDVEEVIEGEAPQVREEVGVGEALGTSGKRVLEGVGEEEVVVEGVGLTLSAALAEGEGEKGGDEEEVGVPMGVDDWEGVG